MRKNLLDQPSPPDPARLEAARPSLVPLGPRTKPSRQFKFRVTLRSQATVKIQVEAATRAKARQAAIEQAKVMSIPQADWNRTVVRVGAAQRVD